MDWFAAALTLVGTYLLADNKVWAVRVFAFVCVLWMYWGWRTGTWSIFALNLVLFATNLRTLYKESRGT